MRTFSPVPVVLGLLVVVQSAAAGGLGIKLYNPGIQMTLPECAASPV